MTDGEIDPTEMFRDALRDLFAQVRRPTYRSLEAHADRDGRALRTSTLSDLLNGPSTPRWDTVETFVRACTRYARARQIQLPQETVDLDRWHTRYRTMENALADQAARREQIAGRAVYVRRRRLAVPAQLPADASAFTGRAHHLADLDKLLPSGYVSARSRHARPTTVVISAIAGTAGVGKTALAVHWAHQIRDHFPDGQLYVNLRGFDPGGQAVDPAAAVRGFLDAFEIPPQRIPTEPDAQGALYRSLLADKRMLIVLDNARDSGQVHPLLPGAPGCLIVVTSRNQLTGLVAAHGAHPLTLDLLSVDEARDLLARRLGADRIVAEPDAVEEIITHCARLPLALTLVVAHAAIQPHTRLRDLADQLHDAQDRWQTLTGDDPTTDVRAVFSWSYHALTPDAARMFRLLGLHPGPDITAAAAASLAGESPNQIRPLLAELTRASLIVEHSPDRYALHDLLRAYATQLAQRTDPDAQSRGATHRILDHYLHTAYTADRLLLLHPNRNPITVAPAQPGVTPEPLNDHQQALDWFTAEHAVLLAAVDHAAATGFDTHTWQLNWALAVFLYRRGHWHDRITTGTAAVAAARRLGDLNAEADAHFSLADVHIRLGRFDDAQTELSHALDLYRRAGDQTGQAHIHHGLGYLWDQRDRPAQALDHARQALDLYRRAGDRAGQANILGTIAWHLVQLGEHEQAVSYAKRAVARQQELGNPAGEAHAWNSLGYAHRHLGHHTQAVTCHQHAIDLFHDLGDRYNEATARTHLGDAHHIGANDSAARAAYRQALAILTDLNHPDVDSLRAKLGALDATGSSVAHGHGS